MQEFITKQMLLDAGIDLQDQDVETLLSDINQTLEERVGSEITDTLNEAQLKTLIDMQEKATDEEIGEWLSKNVPNFEEIVKEEIETILDELLDSQNETAEIA
jgi:uncharacterized protein DUF5663